MTLDNTVPGTPPSELRPETFLRMLKVRAIMVKNTLGTIVSSGWYYHPIEVAVFLECYLLYFNKSRGIMLTWQELVVQEVLIVAR